MTSAASETIELRCCHGVVVVRPGDRVLITTSIPQDELSDYTVELAERLPGIDFLVLNGDVQLAVQRPGDEGNSQ